MPTRHRPSPPWLIRRAALGLTASCALFACGVRPPPAPTLEGGAATSAAAPEGWIRHSDREQIRALLPTARQLWALTDEGLVGWARQTGAFRAETGPGAPGPRATAVAVGEGDRLYVGLPDGLAWRDGQGWRTARLGFLAGGVQALAPRAGGGVWVAGRTGLGWFARGRLHVVAAELGITGLAAGTAGRLWASTRDQGVLAVTATRIETHGPAGGLCGLNVRQISASPDGRVAALCADGSLSLWDGSRWSRLVTRRMAAVRAVHPRGAGLALHTATGWLSAAPGEPTPEAAAGQGPALIALPPAQIPSPPAQRPAPPAAPPSGVPRPPPIPPATPLQPQVISAPLPRQAAPARAAGPVVSWRVAALAEAEGISDGVAAVGPDGSFWRVEPGRGVIMIRGHERRRYSALSLLPKDSPPQLVGDQDGVIYWADGQGTAWRFDGRRWQALVAGPGRITGLSVDRGGRLWVAAVIDPPAAPPGDPEAGLVHRPAPKLRLLQGTGGVALREVIRLPVAATGDLLTGQPHVDPEGTVYVPLQERLPQGTRGLGLAVVDPAQGRLVLWPGRLGLDGEGEGPTPVLPDAWVNSLWSDGATHWIGTNAGLARIGAGGAVVFDENAFIDSEVILSVAAEAPGRLWVGTLEGLGRLEGDVWHPVQVPGLSGPVHALHRDADGSLWVGTDSGLWVQRSAGEGLVPVPVDGRTDFGAVRAIWVAPDQTLWLATAQGVLQRVPAATERAAALHRRGARHARAPGSGPGSWRSRTWVSGGGGDR